jgi:26S proteasome regulatory subunit T2
LYQEERSKVDELRGTPMSVGTLEEIIDDNHAIVSTSVGSEHYVNILSFVDKDLLEPGCTVLLNYKVIMTTPGLYLLMRQGAEVKDFSQ